MPKDFFSINHRVMLDLYTRSIRAHSDRDVYEIISLMVNYGIKILQSDCQRSLSAYNRYIELLKFRLGSHAAIKRLKPEELLPPIAMGGMPGISIVTCAMNRTENLLRALPSWLRFAEIKEVIIVDWSSQTPVSEALNAHSFNDDRIKVVRVNGEVRWILSYAFNVGFRHVTFSTIMKIDADIILNDRYFELNKLPGSQTFLAGNHKIAEKGQEHINGFLVASRSALAKSGGYNEYITSYGWDDDDLYERLVNGGLERIDVVPTSLYHIPHSDSQRTGVKDGGFPITIRDLMVMSTRYQIHCNRIVCGMLPAWDEYMLQLPMIITSKTTSDVTLERLPIEHALIPEELLKKASRACIREILFMDFGSRVWDLSEEAIDALLGRPTHQLTNLDIEVALIDYTRIPQNSGRYLVLALDADLLDSKTKRMDSVRIPALEELLKLAKKRGLNCVVYYPHGRLPKASPTSLSTLVGLHEKSVLDGVAKVSLRDLTNNSLDIGGDVWIHISARELLQRGASPPALNSRKPRLFIDVQHGLGNRLRALASAAVVSQRTDRDLVLVWVPDHHCDCIFSDLFDATDIEVIDTHDQLPANQILSYSYMESDFGALKDQPINLNTNHDVLVRSAYVINHPASNCDELNLFLRFLRPNKRVLDLVESVDVSDCVAAHVRMEGSRGQDLKSYDSAKNWGALSHQQIQYWRSKSHYSSFIRRIEELLSDRIATRIFLAADMPETYCAFAEQFGDRLSLLQRNNFDRSAEGIIYGLADAILLSKCNYLLGSTWSSFTELAQRLSTTIEYIEMSGEDF